MKVVLWIIYVNNLHCKLVLYYYYILIRISTNNKVEDLWTRALNLKVMEFNGYKCEVFKIKYVRFLWQVLVFVVSEKIFDVLKFWNKSIKCLHHGFYYWF